MEESGGAMAANGAKPSAAAGEDRDRLSSLPDEVLVLILLRLGTAAAAGRTSVLSRRWRRVWALLPELRFPAAPSPHTIASALAAHEAEAALSHLLVVVKDAALGSVAAWLPAAARRLSGSIVLRNWAAGGNRVDGGEEEEGGAFELPCFERATSVSLDLGFLGLALPPAGVFGRLTVLSLRSVQFHGPCQLSDAISSPRFPCLQKLIVSHARGLENIAIHSDSLLQVELRYLDRLQHLTIVALALQGLLVCSCFDHHQLAANISAPQLLYLSWIEPYDQTSVKLGNLGQLQQLHTDCYFVYGKLDSRTNLAFLLLLKRFPGIRSLQTRLIYPTDIGNSQYLMQRLTMLPRIKSLTLILSNKGHNFGASLFHILSLCTCLGVLRLWLHKAQSESACPSGCICDQPTNWKTEELILKHLQEVVITDMKGSDHELTVMKRLLCWALKLKKLRLMYHSVNVSKAKEVHEKLLSLAMPETHVTKIKAVSNKSFAGARRPWPRMAIPSTIYLILHLY